MGAVGGIKIKSKNYDSATFVMSRHPKFKVHSSVGHAKNALNAHNKGFLLRLVDGDWYPTNEWRLPDECDNCGRSFVDTKQKYAWRPARNKVYAKRNAGFHEHQYWCDECHELVPYDERKNLEPIERNYWVIPPEKQEEIIKFIEDNW